MFTSLILRRKRTPISYIYAQMSKYRHKFLRSVYHWTINSHFRSKYRIPVTDNGLRFTKSPLSANFRRKGASRPPTVGVRNRWLPFRSVSKYPQCIALCDHNSPTLQTYELGDIKGVGNFEATFWVEGLHFAPMSMYRYIGEWLYYNFAARSFHKKKLCSRLYSIKVAFYSKIHKNRFLCHPLGGLRCNVHAFHL